MILQLAQNFQFFQNRFISFLTAVHPAILHNIAKIEIIKKAFHQLSTEHLEGAYFEFGVYEGSSFLAALRIHRKMCSRAWQRFYLKKIERNFYGFDSFDEGFKYSIQEDKHPFFREGDFPSSYKKCLNRIRKFKNAKLIKGYFEDTVQDKSVEAVLGKKELCALAFIDCDLMKPALVALEFLAPILQRGTILILDDFYAYGGDPRRGCHGAFQVFSEKNKNIKLRPFLPYGYNGMSFIVYEV